MAAFASALTIAIPILKDVATTIKGEIDKKTTSNDVSKEASVVATTAAGNDKKKGPAAAKAVVPVLSDAAKAAVDDAAKQLSLAYSKAQRQLSAQLAIAADLGSFFEAEDNLYAMKEVITYKDFGKKLTGDDRAILKEWWSTAAENLTTIGNQGTKISELEDPEKHDLEFVVQAVKRDNIVTKIGDALKSLEGGNPQPSVLYSAVDDLYKNLHKATFATLTILQGLSDGLSRAADKAGN